VKIVVLGAGALGSILAAHLARAGEDVTLIARGPRAKLLAERGLTVRGLADFTVNVPIVERPQESFGGRTCDVFVLTAKTYDTLPALDGVRSLKPDMAMSVQNGVVKNDHLAAVFGWEQTAGCIANFSGEVTPDGAVLFTRNEGLYFGELPGVSDRQQARGKRQGARGDRPGATGKGQRGRGWALPAAWVKTAGMGSAEGTPARFEALAKVLNEAGIKAIASDRIRSVEWSKYATWMGLTAVAVLSRLYTHQLYQDDDLDILQTDLTREAVKLASAFDVDVMDLGGLIFPKTMSVAATDECVAVLKKAGAAMEAGGTTTHRMSALQDLLRGRRLEVEETFGYAVAKGAELGVPLPGLETCYRLLAAISRHGNTAG
jgi:2-dehydropantoate 2-reductase